MRLLAGLHERLHEISGPDRIAAIGPGRTLLHLDLRPNNVVLTAEGPFVIDWANARLGHRADDVAQTIAIVRSALADPAFAGREASIVVRAQSL